MAVKGSSVSLETRKKISQILTGRKRPKISEALKRYYQEHEVWNKGIKHSDETKERISISCRRSGVRFVNSASKQDKNKFRKRQEG